MWESTHLIQGSAKPVVDDEKITLYNMRFCPFAERTVLVLLAKNVPFENVNINLKNKPDWFIESTLGKVPVLLFKGKVVPESLITSDYLDEAFPEPKLHPSDPLQKALDKVVVEKVGGSMRYLYPLFTKFPPLPNNEMLELFQTLVQNLEKFDEEIKSRGSLYLGGETPCMADYMIWPIFERIECLPILHSDLKDQLSLPSHLSSLNSWIKAMRNTEPVKMYGFSPERMAKLTSVHNKTKSYDDALKESSRL